MSLEPTLAGEEDREASAQHLARALERSRGHLPWRRRQGAMRAPQGCGDIDQGGERGLRPRQGALAAAAHWPHWPAGGGRRVIRTGSSRPPRSSLPTPPGSGRCPISSRDSAPRPPRRRWVATSWQHFLAGPPTGRAMFSPGSRDFALPFLTPVPGASPLVPCSHADARSGHAWPGSSFSVHTCPLHCLPSPGPKCHHLLTTSHCPSPRLEAHAPNSLPPTHADVQWAPTSTAPDWLCRSVSQPRAPSPACPGRGPLHQPRSESGPPPAAQPQVPRPLPSMLGQRESPGPRLASAKLPAGLLPPLPSPFPTRLQPVLSSDAKATR